MNAVIDKFITVCAVFTIIIIGVVLYQNFFQESQSVNDRISLIQEDAQEHYKVNATVAWISSNDLFFEICDSEDMGAFKRYVYKQMKKYHLEHLYSLTVNKSSELK